MRLELDAPNVGELEKEYITRTIDSGYISTFGPFVSEFEVKFAAYLGTKRAISTQSGTAALHVTLHELGIGKGDEVIVSALTFIATVNPIVYVGATPVFVDVNSQTWNIDPEEIKSKINKKTKAIIPVHLYGNPCEMDKIMEIAEERGIHVIEDATESLGAKYKKKYTGTFGNAGCFSFNGNKTITTGGGGMVVGNDIVRMDHIKFLVNQARDEAKGYYHPEVGFNYRLTNIEAALGLAQMEKLENFSEKKKLYNQIYRKELSDIECVSFQKESEGAESSWWLTCVRFDKGVDVNVIQSELKKREIPTRRLFMPVTEFPPYANLKNGTLKNCHDIYETGLCLPSSTRNSVEDIQYVCEAIKGLLK